jgi:probable HAF family extracellular repeat protein
MPVYIYTTLVGPPGSSDALPNGINNQGQIVGSYNDAITTHGFLYSAGAYTTVDDPVSSGEFTVANGINGSGQIVGYYLDGNGDKHGFLDSSGTYTTLDYPSARQTFAQSINRAGQIVGSSSNDGHAFLYSGGTYTTLDSALNGGTPFGINDSGQIVGTYSTFENGGFKTHGFLYSNGTFIPLDYPGATDGTFAYGINNQGQIVGSYSDFDDIHGGGGVHGFLYSGGTYTTFDDPFAAISATEGTQALGINDAGQIVGTYQDSNHHYHGFLLTIAPNPPPPVGTTADMILRGANNSPAVMGQYEIYDIGNNAILAGYQLGRVGTDWSYTGLGTFFGSDITDMLLRNSGTGGFEVYDISNNLITNAAFLGTIGLDWEVQGFGNFSGNPGESDMILRNTSITGLGGFEVYDIRNNQITGANFMGRVGLTWSVQGFGDFNGDGTSDMIMRNGLTGQLQVYDIANNQFTGSAPMGTIGREWRASGFGDFNGDGTTDMIMRNFNTGDLQLYDIANNQITNSFFLGTIGLDWRFAGVAPIHAPGASDLVLRNINTGQFEVYDIANNHITGAHSLGAVGLDWQIGGLAVDPPTGAGAFTDGSSDQLVQAMAGFGGGGAGETLDAGPLSAETSQQALLTTSQHA